MATQVMDGQSLNILQDNLEKLKQLFPQIFTEGGEIDFEKFKATFTDNINFNNERYVLNWAGKSEAFKVLQTPSTKTLIPAKDESVNFEETNNIFIEGENMEVLKVLQKSYFGQVKMIYIDPPYNTGYKSIADIAKERIRRAARKIEEEVKAEQEKKKSEIAFDEEEENPLDLGFKVLKLSDSNFKQWRQTIGKDAKALAEQIKLFVDPVAESATVENMVYELLLKSGKDLNSKIEKKNGFFTINKNELVLILEKATQDIIEAVISEKPVKVIALDKLFTGNDQLKTNTVLQMKDAGVEFKTI